jgi:deazaflavin-dependent oxidoreductase (nitroreductase family)
MPIPKSIANFNKHVTNKFFLIFAGRLSPFAIVNHKGRRSGRSYRTPILAFPTEAGYVFALTYGRDVDWVRNLVAADGGTLRRKGKDIPIHRVRVVGYEDVKHLFPSWIKRSLARISLKDCVTVDAERG